MYKDDDFFPRYDARGRCLEAFDDDEKTYAIYAGNELQTNAINSRFNEYDFVKMCCTCKMCFFFNSGHNS